MEKPIYLNTFKNDGNGPLWKNGKCELKEALPPGTYDVSIWETTSQDGKTKMMQITIKDQYIKDQPKTAPSSNDDLDDIPL